MVKRGPPRISNFFMYWWMTRMNKCTQWLKHASSSNPTNHKVSLRKKLTSSLHFWIGGKTFERLVHLSNCNLSSRGDPGAPWWPPFEILMVRRTFFLKRDPRGRPFIQFWKTPILSKRVRSVLSKRNMFLVHEKTYHMRCLHLDCTDSFRLKIILWTRGDFLNTSPRYVEEVKWINHHGKCIWHGFESRL